MIVERACFCVTYEACQCIYGACVGCDDVIHVYVCQPSVTRDAICNHYLENVPVVCSDV